MANLRNKLYILLAALIFSASFINAQTTTDEMNPVIQQGVEAAQTGIEYWNAEIPNSIYCNEKTAEVCASMNATCTREVKKWTAELSHQLTLAKNLAEANASYSSVSKYLKFAYKTLAALKALNADLKLPELKILISGLETAIKVAEKIISIFK